MAEWYTLYDFESPKNENFTLGTKRVNIFNNAMHSKIMTCIKYKNVGGNYEIDKKFTQVNSIYQNIK
jgi:hypothetical protein